MTCSILRLLPPTVSKKTQSTAKFNGWRRQSAVPSLLHLPSFIFLPSSSFLHLTAFVFISSSSFIHAFAFLHSSSFVHLPAVISPPSVSLCPSSSFIPSSSVLRFFHSFNSTRRNRRGQFYNNEDVPTQFILASTLLPVPIVLTAIEGSDERLVSASCVKAIKAVIALIPNDDDDEPL